MQTEEPPNFKKKGPKVYLLFSGQISQSTLTFSLILNNSVLLIYDHSLDILVIISATSPQKYSYPVHRGPLMQTACGSGLE